MARLFGILAAIFTLASCSSGVSNTGAGAAGTNCAGGELNMVCTASIQMETFSFDAFASDTDGDGFPDELLETETGTVTITISDPLGEFSNTFQGATFETYDVSYNSGQGGAPNLGPRRFTNTLSITMSNSTGTGSIDIPIVDLVTLREFAEQASGSTVYPYVVTVRATGRDFATNSVVVAVARANIEIGNFVESVPEPPEEEGSEEEEI
ncbi:MAG TPA: hypothetical protein VK973_12735 [Arenicellales bacterium]|nr:hypothetical protein [Arenicellales bacterium]